MIRNAAMVGIMALGLGLPGCAENMVHVVRSAPNPSVPNAVGGGPASGTVVPRGAQFAVRLDQAIDTATSHEGDAFEARLLEPLVASNGEIAAPEGARVIGHVAGLLDGHQAMIRLAFDAVETTHGLVSIEAAVRDAQRQLYRSRERVPMAPTARYGDTAVYEPTFGATYSYSLGPTGGGYAMPVLSGHAREARLDVGARMRLALTKPFTVPGSVPSH